MKLLQRMMRWMGWTVVVCGASGCQTVGRISSNPAGGVASEVTARSSAQSSSERDTHNAPKPGRRLDLRPHRLVATAATASRPTPPLRRTEPSPARPSAKPKKKAKKYTLRELLVLAWKRSPALRKARYELESMRARKSEAVWSSWWPQGSVVAVVAPAPPARGDALTTTTPYPEAYNRLNQYGVLTRVELSLVWPLYTFGKLTLLQNAATHGVRLSQAKVLLEKNKWAVFVKKAYFGLQFAESSLVLLDEAEEKVDEAKKKVKAKTDRLKIKVIESQVKSRRVEAQTGLKLAQSGLSRLTGLPKPIRLAEPELEEASIQLLSLTDYQRLARLHRPEMRILEHALRAKRALLHAKQRLWLPDFFIAGFFRWGYSSAADDQVSPFARDDFNFLEGGGVLGMRWNLDIPITLSKIRRAEADFEAFRSQRTLALQGIKMQVEQKYRELAAAKKLVSIHRSGREAASQWMTRTMMAFQSGLTEVKDVSEALLAYAQTQVAYLEAMYKLNLAIAGLTRAVGVDVARRKKDGAK